MKCQDLEAVKEIIDRTVNNAYMMGYGSNTVTELQRQGNAILEYLRTLETEEKVKLGIDTHSIL